MLYAGDRSGEGFSAQANLMASSEVWPAMASAFESAVGPLARRLLSALDAGEAAGGDVRGRQSAALLVVPAAGEPWQTRVELRVEDARDPLGELRRLLDLADAYEVANRADELAGEGRHEEAAELYAQAADAAPANVELSLGRARDRRRRRPRPRRRAGSRRARRVPGLARPAGAARPRGRSGG